MRKNITNKTNKSNGEEKKEKSINRRDNYKMRRRSKRTWIWRRKSGIIIIWKRSSKSRKSSSIRSSIRIWIWRRKRWSRRRRRGFSYLEAMRDTAGFLIDKGNINISLANSLSFFPNPLLNHPLFSCVACLPFGDSRTARASDGWTISFLLIELFSS